MQEGFAYMLRTPWLLSSLIFGSIMVLVIMGPFDVLIPFLMKDRLGVRARGTTRWCSPGSGSAARSGRS